jgi:hypothetical protein
LEKKAVTPSKGKKKIITTSKNGLLVKKFAGNFLCDPEDVVSVDLSLYINGEIKDIYNLRMMRIWKRLAIDGPNNRARNQLETDEDYTIKSDYDVAKYTYWCEEYGEFKDVQEIDYSTYDVLYSEKDILNICNEIIQYLIFNGSININLIFEMWVNNNNPKYRDKIVWLALERLLSSKMQVTNRLGFASYISSNQGTIFLQNDFPFNEDKDSNNLMFYSDIVIGVETTPISKILNKLLEPKQDTIIDSILAIEQITEEDIVKDLIDKLNLNYKARLLEKALNEYMENDELMQDYIAYLKEKNPTQYKDLVYVEEVEEPRPIIQYILNKFNMYVYTDILEPYIDISETANVMATKNVKSTKKQKIKIKYAGESITEYAHKDGTPYEEGEEEIEGDVIRLNRVYIHTLLGTEAKSVSYNATSNFENVGGRKRILKPAEALGWRDLNSYEEAPYVNVLKKKLNEKLESVTVNDVYGTILMSDKEFRIVDKTDQETSNDNRNTKKGRICREQKKPPLIRILLRENIMTPTVKNVDLDIFFDFEGEQTDKSKLKTKMEFLVDKKYFTSIEKAKEVTKRDIDFICKWYASDTKVEKMCNIILNLFRKTGRFYETDI